MARGRRPGIPKGYPYLWRSNRWYRCNFAYSNSQATPSTYYESKPSSPPPAPPKLIPPTSIEVRDIRWDFSGSYVNHVTVRLFNNSSTETLKKAEYRLTVADCKSGKNNLAKKSEDGTTVDDETGSFELDDIRRPPQPIGGSAIKRRDVGYLPRTNKKLGGRPVVNDDE